MGAAWGVAGLAWLWLAAATGDGRPVHEARRVPGPTARAGTPRTHRHRAPKAPRRRARKVTPSAARDVARTDPQTAAGAARTSGPRLPPGVQGLDRRPADGAGPPPAGMGTVTPVAPRSWIPPPFSAVPPPFPPEAPRTAT